MQKMLFPFLLLFLSSLQGQKTDPLSSSEIFQEIQELNFLGSIMYVAAHPDDENTRLISYLSNGLNARTAYLSLTRGDGGQNLLGPELREVLGVIRTQELLAARRIDGGEQFFTRANDFGYSKHPEETLQIWDEEAVLEDVVRIFRTFRPDVIINRFQKESAGETHGHHTASAILSTKAFKMAGNPAIFPDQASETGTWAPKKLFFNTSPWFFDSPEVFEALDKSDFVRLQTGVYYPLTGNSNTEIAARSRSQHRSQGFGTSGTRGKTNDYLQLVAGDHPQGSQELFAGIPTTWSRIKGGDKLEHILGRVENEFNFQDPAASIPDLVKAYSLILNLEDPHWKNIKSRKIRNIIAACAGLYMEGVTGEAKGTPGEKLPLRLEVINRSEIAVVLKKVTVLPSLESFAPEILLENNIGWTKELQFKIPDTSEFSGPYWLRKKGQKGLYTVEDRNLIGLPETPEEFQVAFTLQIGNVEIPFRKPLVFKSTDPVLGETYRSFEVVPKLSVSATHDIMIFPDSLPQVVPVRLTAMADTDGGILRLDLPGSWKAKPRNFSFGPLKEGEQHLMNFVVTPPKNQETVQIRPTALVQDNIFFQEVKSLEYPHFPPQTILLPQWMQLVRLEIKKKGDRVAYIPGAGDAIPEALEQIGYSVTRINPNHISAKMLSQYDAVVLGIRAYNVLPELRNKQPELMTYVRNGGNLLVQYNTNRGLVTEHLGPYPLKLSRDRVTNEAAPVTFLAADHPVLNTPNKITAKDFQGWVQERGLYFPDQWTKDYTPVLSMNDPGETPKQGALLIAQFGKGTFIYTGLSFFRELPAGVPGAYRLLANLISLEPDNEPKTVSP